MKQPITTIDHAFSIGKKNVLTEDVAHGLLSGASNPAAGDVLVVDPSMTSALSAGGAKIIVQPDGSFIYDPTTAFPTLGQGQTFDDTFTYVVDDSFGSTATATVHITVTGVEDAPVAPNYDITDGVWTVPGQAVTVPASQGLLSKAYSPDAGMTGKLTAFGKGPSKYGATVTVNPDGSFTYDPTTSTIIQQLTAQGQDIVDSFDYGVTDPLGPVTDPTFPIVVKGGPSPYRYDVVAAVKSGNYHDLGIGPSINNLGNVAFEGTTPGNQGNLYIWPPQPDPNPLNKITGTPQAISILGDWAATHSLTSDFNKFPAQIYDPRVQINDSNYVIAQRTLLAGGLIGALPYGIPDVVPTQFALTYGEIYFGGAALQGTPTAAAYQVAAGDSGISASGVQWGSPNLMDMILAGVIGAIAPALGITGFGALAEAFTNLMLTPKAWVTAPDWGSVFPSPVDSAWEPILWNINRQAGGATAIQLTSTLALLFELAPDQILRINSRPTILPPSSPACRSATSRRRRPPRSAAGGSSGGGGLPDFSSFNPGYIAFSASARSGFSGVAPGDYLVTANHFQAHPTDPTVAGYRWIIQPTDGNTPVQVKVGDTGISVASTGKSLDVYNFDLQDNPFKGGDLQNFGLKPAISDGTDPWIAFAANSPKLGNGIFVANADTVDHPDQWFKVAGVSGDGHLDPNEAWVDQDNNMKFDGNEDQGALQTIDLNGEMGISKNAFGELTVSFFGTTKDQKGNNHYGLQTVQVSIPDDTAEPRDKLPPVAPLVVKDQNQQQQSQQPNGPPLPPQDDPAKGNPNILPRTDLLGFTTVASEGDIIPGAGTILTGTDQKHSINTYDPINNYGQVVFWANTDQGQVIIRANPPLQPRGQVVAALETVDVDRNTGLVAMADGNKSGADGMGAVVGTFIASNPQTKVTDYEAKIDWGDGGLLDQVGLGGKVTITQADKVTYDDNGKVTSTASAGDNVYAIAAHHKYAREGTYVITIYVTDKKDNLGGVGTAIANVINVVSIESPEKYVEVGADGTTLTHLSSHATRGIAGIPSSITTKPTEKSFTDTALGASGKYDYSFQLSQDNGNNQAKPNVIIEGHSATLTLASLNTSGNLNLDDFNTRDFKVTEYTVSTTATETNNPGADYKPMITALNGDTYSVTTSSTTTITDAKTYKSANTELSWTHTATATSTFLRKGERPSATDIGNQANGLTDQDPSALADMLTNLSLVGAYSMTGTATSTATTTETGSEQGKIKRDYRVVQDATVTQTAGLEGFFQTQTDHSQSTESIQNGVFNYLSSVGTGYSVTIESHATNTILGENQTRGPQQTTMTGSNTVDATFIKTGVNLLNNTDFGGFQTTTTITTHATSVPTITNEDSKTTEHDLSTSTLIQVANASPAGILQVQGALTKSHATVVSHQTDDTQTVDGDSVDDKTQTVVQGGTLFTGQYTVTNTSNESFTNQATTTDLQLKKSVQYSHGTATASTTDTSDRKSGPFTIHQESTSTQTTTNNYTDVTQSSTVTSTATNTAQMTKTGDLRRHLDHQKRRRFPDQRLHQFRLQYG